MKGGSLFGTVECDVHNDRRRVGCTHTHTHREKYFINYELHYVSEGESLGAVTVKGDSCAGDSLPYEE